MDTTTCGICHTNPSDDNSVAPVIPGTNAPLACDRCCELLLAELDLLAILR